MCGISGVIVPEGWSDPAGLLRRMNLSLAHRGPDGDGFFETQTHDGAYRVGLGHRRLAIIDLATGDQPMGNEDGSVQLVFNGEIYNFQALRDELIACGYRFSTRSDTETIIHAYQQWGDDCVLRFRGMFAFALWDARRQRLLLARDRFGKKPLFLHERGGALLFGSEIKAILSCTEFSRSVDQDAIWQYLAYRYVPAPATLFAGIRKLMPGSLAVWERGILKERVYARPPDREVLSASEPTGDVVDAFLQKLDESVRIRMIADVPFGAFLSGGIDSSAVVGLMSRHSSQPVKTFSVGFSESAYSELGYAKEIAQLFKTDHHELVVSQDHLIEHLPALVRFRDAPVAEPSDIPIYLLSVEAGRTVKMVLTGEGSDEVLGGYPKHVFERYANSYQRLPGLLRSGLIEPLISALPYRFHRAKTAAANLGLPWQERMPRWFGALSNAERIELAAMPPPAETHAGPQFDSSPENSALRRILYFDQTSWLPDNLLERGDRMTMAASIEGRMPFMDHELAAFVSALPDHWRVRGRSTKRILREAMTRLLPAAILQRPKVGFRVPVNEWFRGPMKAYLCDHLLGADSRTAALYNRPKLQALVSAHIEGRQNHEKLLWSLLNLEIWHREYGVSA